MIRIICTSCKKELQIDDAFAGGVCRCQYCGTIQTVASAAKGRKTAAAPRTLFETKKGSALSGSGLEDLADIVASSGLSDRNLRTKPPEEPPPASNRVLLFSILGVGVAVVFGIVVYLVLHHAGGNVETQPQDTTPVNQAAPAPPPVAKPGPSFCGTPLSSDMVVYVIDNGASSGHFLDALKSAVLKSADSLGEDGRFQIIFWNPQTGTYPTGQQTAHAVKDNVEAARKKLDDVMALGSTDPLAALADAFADQPGEIVLVTGKAADLDPDLVEKVMVLRGSSTAKIDCFAINGNANDRAFSQIALKTGGTFVYLPESALKVFAE